MEGLQSKNKYNGKATDPASESCRHLEQEIPDEWNGELGLLTDDDILTHTGTASNQSKEASTDDLQGQNNSVNNDAPKEGKRTPYPKLQHHLSWQNALKKAKSLPDPWEKFHIDDSCLTEVAIRHRYNALKKNWVQDEVRIKMELLVSLLHIKYDFVY